MAVDREPAELMRGEKDALLRTLAHFEATRGRWCTTLMKLDELLEELRLDGFAIVRIE